MDETNVLGRRFEFDNEFFRKPRRYGPITLFQVGELCCECGYEVPEHVQVCSEISFILAGEGSFSVDGKAFPVEEGDIFLNREGERHSIRSSSQHNLRFLYVGFRVDLEEKDADLRSVFEFFSSPIKERKQKDRMGITEFFLKMLGEIYSVSPYSQKMVSCYLTQIIILTYRTFHAGEKPQTAGYAKEAKENVVGGTVYGVIRHVEKNILTVGNVRSIAAELGYSSTYLSHLFRRKAGMTLQRFISFKKMEKSLELMDSGQYSITQIAMMLNFLSVQSFSKAFKRTFGFPPSEYQGGQMQQKAAAMVKAAEPRGVR